LCRSLAGGIVPVVDGPQLETERLLLRRWREHDREPYAALNADPRVREHFVSTLTRAQSDAQMDGFEAHFERRGYGIWALELRASGELLGFTGFDVATYDAPFTPAVEIGWRLAHAHWGCGYATEAAQAALAYGFDDLGIDEIVATTSVGNARSRAVMDRLGMARDAAGDFDHPEVPPQHPLCRHVLYRLAAADWRRTRRT
jgi:RimJ/RimL family protein N-acetyltransferase